MSYWLSKTGIRALTLFAAVLVATLPAARSLAACGWIETQQTVCTTFGNGQTECETTFSWDYICLGGGGGSYDPADYPTGGGGGGGGTDPGLPPSGNHFDVDGDGETDCFLNLVESTKTTQNPLPDWANLGGKFGGPNDGVRWKHNGVDIAANRGDLVRAAQEGTVTEILTGQVNKQQNINTNVNGNFVRVAHDDGTAGAYLHLHSIDPAIQLGSRVFVGQTLGTANDTGESFGDHLHYTNWITHGTSAENPEINHGNCP
jgi:hypothetical protein